MTTNLIMDIKDLIKAGAKIECLISPTIINNLDSPLHQSFTITLNNSIWYRSVPLNIVLNDIIWDFNNDTPEPINPTLETKLC